MPTQKATQARSKTTATAKTSPIVAKAIHDANAKALADANATGSKPATTAPDEKTCRVCGIVQDIDSFGRKKGTPDGHTSYCKACAALYNTDRVAYTALLDAAKVAGRTQTHTVKAATAKPKATGSKAKPAPADPDADATGKVVVVAPGQALSRQVFPDGASAYASVAAASRRSRKPVATAS